MNLGREGGGSNFYEFTSTAKLSSPLIGQNFELSPVSSLVIIRFNTDKLLFVSD